MAEDTWQSGGWTAGGGDGAPSIADRPLVHPPLRFLMIAGAMVALSIALMPFTRVGAHLVGWAVGSLLTVALMAVYTAVDQRSRLSASYSAKPNQQTIRNVLWVTGVLVATAHAWYIANYYAS